MENRILSGVNSPRLLVTGATGFVGQAVAEHILKSAQYKLTVSVRGACPPSLSKAKAVQVDSLSGTTNWVRALHGVDTVIHLAARAHVLREPSSSPTKAFRYVNVDGTLRLARQALDQGVKRFVFVSSIGVNGTSAMSRPHTELSEPLPEVHYAVSKLEAEQGLWSLCKDTDMELVIIRPPLVYAGHAPGNFGRLLKLVASGIPLPFASVANRRSMIALENLTNFIMLCVGHPSAGNQLFLASDGEDLSTPSIVRYLAEGMNKPVRLFPVPVSLMRLGAKVLHRDRMFDQLCGSLVIDSSKAHHLLGWRPPLEVSHGLKKAARDYLLLD